MEEELYGMGKFRDPKIQKSLRLAIGETGLVTHGNIPLSKKVILCRNMILSGDRIIVVYFEEQEVEGMSNWEFAIVSEGKEIQLHFDFRFLGVVFGSDGKSFSVFYRNM